LVVKLEFLAKVASAAEEFVVIWIIWHTAMMPDTQALGLPLLPPGEDWDEGAALAVEVLRKTQ